MQSGLTHGRPAIASTYEIAGRFVLVESPSVAVAEAADRLLSSLRFTREVADKTISRDVTLSLSMGEFLLPHDVKICIVSEEAAFYNNDHAYIVRLGSSAVAAGSDSLVNLTLAHDLDPGSFLFERVLSHGLATAMRRAGAFELHCAAVIDPQTGKSALIIGPSGSGKSTITLHLAATGWNFSTDDVVLLTKQENRVMAYGLREGFRLTGETIVKSGLSQLDTVLQREPTGADLKLPLQPQEFFASRFIKNCVPELLFFPRQTREDQSRIEPL